MDGIDLSADIPAYPDSFDNPNPLQYVSGAASTADVANTNSGGGIFTGAFPSIKEIFTNENFKTGVQAGLDYVKLKTAGGTSKPATGPSPQYVGAVNPPPGDWISNIFTKLAQPNKLFSSPDEPSGASSGLSKTTLYILAGLAVMFVLILGRK